MRGSRKLVLNVEKLGELRSDELRAVAGASGATCPQVSNIVISLCGCLTEYCSIDVC